MSFRVRFTREVRDDLERLYQWLLDRADGDFATAERALQAVRDGIAVQSFEVNPAPLPR